MTDIHAQIDDLKGQLDNLRNNQLQMYSEMNALEDQLARLKASVSSVPAKDKIAEPAVTVSIENKEQFNNDRQPIKESIYKRKNLKSSFDVSRDLEDFIGTNLISKIGILITIIGVFIGAKYAIDKELISPLMRIIVSYLVAGVLFFIGLRLKLKYESFSSILMAGGLAVTYFITYIAFSFYQLFPQSVAFAMMIITTVAAVAVALWYNQKVIALIGQVAAYAIPFLLGDGRGNVAVLFAYISIINIGLLVLSFKKDWKILYHIAFFLTWLIYASWMLNSNNTSYKFSTGLLFLTINFFTFYVTFLSYKIFKQQMYRVEDISILLLNALFFFFLGIYLINQNYSAQRALTWFTLANAVIHFGVGYCIYRLRLADVTVFQFILGLGLLFVTVAMPMEFNGSWVTLFWTVEATTLFYLASSNNRGLYLKICGPLVIISLLSLLQDWSVAYPFIQGEKSGRIISLPFANLNFWLSLFVCSCFGYMSYKSTITNNTALSPDDRLFFSKLLPVIFIFLLYFTFYNELHLTWDKMLQQTFNDGVRSNYADAQTLTLLIYSCLYIAGFMLINLLWIRSPILNSRMLMATVLVNLVMVFKGLYVLGELRDNYIQGISPFNWLIFIRYWCFIALAVVWITIWKATRIDTTTSFVKVFFSLLFNFILLCIICNEFIHWMDLAGYVNQYKLGLSIISGVYALSLVFAGILKKKKHLRIGGIALFSLTILKLFFYDLASLSTISKTVVLLMLGILLLIASFLYNKYKDPLFSSNDQT